MISYPHKIEANNPNRAGQLAGQKFAFGDHKRFALAPLHTRFDAVTWFVWDAETVDPVTKGPAVIRQEASAALALHDFQDYVNADHLTYPRGAALLAWHTSLDVCAIQDQFGRERLVIRGDVFELPTDWHRPVQQVINLCRMGKRAAIKALAEIRQVSKIAQD